MRLSNGIYGLLIVFLISAGGRLWAHHSFAAEYDGSFEDERDQAHLKGADLPTSHYNEEHEKEKK